MAILINLRRLVVCVLSVMPAWNAVPTTQETLENDVKAAYLYNFTRFVDWPVARGGARDAFRICAVAEPAFIQVLDRTLENESVQGVRLVRVEPQTVEQARSCQILYVGRGAADRGLRLVAGVRQAPVLTVSDAPRFLDQGGMIAFVLDGTHLRFDVSNRAATEAGLTISSKLLRLARHVDSGARQ